METVGEHIVRMQTLINTPMIPCPEWGPDWQTNAEHVLYLAHKAKDSNDIDKLIMLDEEALRLNRRREIGLKDY